MILRNLLFFFIIFIFFLSCSKQKIENSTIEEVNLELQMIEAYNIGFEELKKGDALFAAKKFNEAEILYPQSNVAPRAALMAAYSYYSQDYYQDSIAELERFLRIYAKDENVPYAKYLLGLCYYEQIVDEKKDLKSISKSKEIFLQITQEYPKTDFAIDASFKLNLINDILASKEMYVGRYYFDRKKWIASINRFKYVIDNYETTIYVAEALHRLVEIYYILGLEEESKKYANLLGYNYQSSQWYENSYSIFNKKYEKNKIQKKDKSILKKFKSFFN
ncbi:outer membrane protein assembly factor BamD [Candidatus Pelagibacter sp. HIMB1715]|uniref:outer membrane protein assembly factor BamD n=1 Tax=Candidatus Pelagibacter sp. HIMB1715 TaxID=3413369 RepID=UPI003F8626D7